MMDTGSTTQESRMHGANGAKRLRQMNPACSPSHDWELDLTSGLFGCYRD